MHLDEHFTFVPSSTDNPGIGGDFEELVGSQVADIDVSITKSLRAKYPDLNVTCGMQPSVKLPSLMILLTPFSQPPMYLCLPSPTLALQPLPSIQRTSIPFAGGSGSLRFDAARKASWSVVPNLVLRRC